MVMASASSTRPWLSETRALAVLRCLSGQPNFLRMGRKDSERTLEEGEEKGEGRVGGRRGWEKREEDVDEG